MPKMSLPHRVVEIPPARRDTHNYLDLYWWKHSIYALLEVDVPAAREFIEEHKARTSEALSFTGYLAFCLGRAVDEDKSVQAYPKGRKHLVIFDDVDVFLPVEREVGATRAAIPYIIRGANHKSYLEIHREIRAFQTQPLQPGSGMPAAFRFMMATPWPLPRLFIRLIVGGVARKAAVIDERVARPNGRLRPRCRRRRSGGALRETTGGTH
jgi:hypothetical protein